MKIIRLIMERKNKIIKGLANIKVFFQDSFHKELLLWIKMVEDPAFNIRFITLMLSDYKKVTIDFLKMKGYDINNISLTWEDPSKFELRFLLFWIQKNLGIEKLIIYAYSRKNFYVNDMKQIKSILNYWLVYKETSKFLENQESNRILLIIFKQSLIRLLKIFIVQLKACYSKF